MPLTSTASPSIPCSSALLPRSSIVTPVSLSASLASSPGYRVPIDEDEPTTFSGYSRFSTATTAMSRNSADVLAATTNCDSEYRIPAGVLNTAHGSALRPEWLADQASRMPVATASAFSRSILQLRLPTEGLADEDVWWVVIQGLRPGAYQGRLAAFSAAGDGLRPIVVKKSTTHMQALAAFGQASMQGLVFTHTPHPPPT
ncbi:hypothetical protein HYPSUDRAFT_209215 [Hypholoma sublateritium FD-334 SS-4]|uniref:Uncharacterized protein n=1 Tax=Hypholoma sublateritium (strain FD-334 SS-4) TaxID=945553 RepID=A0A0D2LSM3_HYPSF|nr:hypothetical protein HYPSUDRAFT_209215 [Hypholoma sublateritium FD-334 SS-4]